MKLVITLRKEVENPDEGRAIYELVKTRLQDHPEIEISGHVTNHYNPPEGPE